MLLTLQARGENTYTIDDRSPTSQITAVVKHHVAKNHIPRSPIGSTSSKDTPRKQPSRAEERRHEGPSNLWSSSSGLSRTPSLDQQVTASLFPQHDPRKQQRSQQKLEQMPQDWIGRDGRQRVGIRTVWSERVALGLAQIR